MTEYNADPTRIYVIDSSSDCMMTNVMCGAYPDVFAAASCYSGVPAGCLEGSGLSPRSRHPSCAIGNPTKTGAECAEQVRGMHKCHEGPYPKMMIWDEIISHTNLAETLKQWSAILDAAWRENITETPPLLNYTLMARSYSDGQLSGLAILYLVMSQEIWIGLAFKVVRRLVHHMGANTDLRGSVIMTKHPNVTPCARLAAKLRSF